MPVNHALETKVAMCIFQEIHHHAGLVSNGLSYQSYCRDLLQHNDEEDFMEFVMTMAKPMAVLYELIKEDATDARGEDMTQTIGTLCEALWHWTGRLGVYSDSLREMGVAYLICSYARLYGVGLAESTQCLLHVDLWNRRVTLWEEDNGDRYIESYQEGDEEVPGFQQAFQSIYCSIGDEPSDVLADVLDGPWAGVIVTYIQNVQDQRKDMTHGSLNTAT